MEWQLALLTIFGGLVIMMALGVPVAFGFLVVNFIGVFLLWGGTSGLEQLILSSYDSVAVLALMPLPLFVLMGEILFRSGIAPTMMDTIDKWVGRLPGRLSLLAVGGGALFSTMTGADIPTIAVLGSVLTPEMEKRGYHKAMSTGPILASGGIAVMIPPSILGVLLGTIGRINIGRILMGIILPGILMTGIYATYIILRCKLQPSIAPNYTVPPSSLPDKLLATAKHILPIGVVIFMVIGVIFLGIAAPTEAAATGAITMLILAAAYRKLNWKVVKASFAATLEITVMLFMIIVGAKTFSQILAYTGAIKGLSALALGLPVAPIFILIGMQLIVLFMGTLMELVSIMMITLPIFVPVILALGFDPVWFAVVYLINITTGSISPPFGLGLFVMKGVAPGNTTMADIYKSAIPFVGLNIIAMAIIMAVPQIALWLPAMMLSR